MRVFACVLMALVPLSACGETASPGVPPDLQRDASVDLDGGDDLDAEVDGGVPDGGAPDAGPDAGPDGGGSWCETSTLCPNCPDPDELCDEDTPCAVGETCLPTGCEDLSRCFVVGGGACESDADCSNEAYACELAIGRCLRKEPGCDDSTDCVSGFACEENACVDRRVPCADPASCPHGYACSFVSTDQRFCRRIPRPCTADVDCLVLGVPCGDADGDGENECMPSLEPNAPDPESCDLTRCASSSAPVCETTEEGTIAVCGQFGLCRTSDQCSEGFQCRDLWGDARLECVVGPGSCADSRDCPTREVCATPRSGGPPTCVGAPAI